MATLLPEETLTKKLVTQSFRVYFFTALAAPLGYFIRAIIASSLSVEDVGIFYSVMGLVTILASFNDLGLTEAMQYFLPKYWINKDYSAYKTTVILTFIIQIITGIIGLLLLYVCANRLALHHFHSPIAADLLKIFAWYFVAINVFQLISAFFTAFQNTFLAQFLNFFKQIAILGFIMYLWISTGFITVTTISSGWLYAIALSVIVGLILFLKKYGYTLHMGTWIPKLSLIREQSKYAWGVLLATNAGLLIGLVDQQFVVNFLGPGPAGIYANYTILLVVYGVLSGPLLAIIFPIVTELIAKHQLDKYSLLQNILYKYYTIGAFTIAGLFFALGPEIATVFFGTKFAYSGALAAVTSPFLVVNIMLAVNFTFLAGLGKVHERARLLIIALVINVVVNLIGFKVLHLGLWSPILATILSWIVLRFGSFKKLNEFYPIHIPYKFLIKNGLIISFLSILLRYVKDFFFIASNAYRYQNIIYLGAASLLYITIVSSFNYKSAILLRNRFKQFRSGI